MHSEIQMESPLSSSSVSKHGSQCGGSWGWPRVGVGDQHGTAMRLKVPRPYQTILSPFVTPLQNDFKITELFKKGGVYPPIRQCPTGKFSCVKFVLLVLQCPRQRPSLAPWLLTLACHPPRDGRKWALALSSWRNHCQDIRASLCFLYFMAASILVLVSYLEKQQSPLLKQIDVNTLIQRQIGNNSAGGTQIL